MKLVKLGLQTSFGMLTVAGGTRAGESTVILLPQLRLALDAGRAHRAVPPMSTIVVSHGHADHMGGLAYWASQRFLGNLSSGTILAPEPICDQIRQLLEIHASLEGGRPYKVSVEAVSDGASRPLRADIEMRFFATDHWVPTLGTELELTRKQLLPELVGLSGPEIADRRRAGEVINRTTRISLLSYCADCGPELMRMRPEVLASEVLLLECSFFKSEDRERAKRYGHMHLDDIIAVADRMQCRHLVLLHASRRHSLREVEAELEKRLQPLLPCQMHHLNVDWD